MDGTSVKALLDITRCILCGRKFISDDVRSNVYKDSTIIGAIHEGCYSDLGLSSTRNEPGNTRDTVLVRSLEV